MPTQTVKGKSSGRFRRNRRLRWLAAAVLMPSLVTGCTRAFFRRQADKEVSEVMAEKEKYPGLSVEQYYVYADPLARFADPTNPDRPPMPPDDPAAWALAPDPQKPHRKNVAYFEGTGYLALLAKWDAENRQRPGNTNQQQETTAIQLGETTTGTGQRVAAAESRLSKKEAEVAAAPPGTQKHPYRITLEQAVILGGINSREFQDERETLYLAALPVTTERFAFAPQFYAAEQAVRNWATPNSASGPENNWTFNSGVGFAKLFSTGALLVANFANQTVVNLTGPFRGTTSTSTFGLDLIQPFLRGGGRAVTLEPLTEAERNLVYQIRAYMRFREEFYVAIAGGGGGAITGGAFVPTGVLSSSGTGVGVAATPLTPGVIGFSTASPNLLVPPGPSGSLFLSTELTAPVSGYLGTSLQFSQIALDEANNRNLEDFLQRFEALKEGGDYSQLQVDQVEQQLLNGRSRLLLDTQQYETSADNLRLQLGVPVTLPIELDDSQLRPIKEQFQRYDNVFKQYEQAGIAATQLRNTAVTALRGELHRLFATSAIVQGTPFKTEFPGLWKQWETAPDAAAVRQRIRTLAAERRRLLDLATTLGQRKQQLSPADQKRLRDVTFDIDIGTFEQTLRFYESKPWTLSVTSPLYRRQPTAFGETIDNFVLVLGEARAQRLAQIRGQWPALPAACLDGVDLLVGDRIENYGLVGRTALTNRLDLMNVRAQFTDAWRQIAIFANALLGTFNVEYRLTGTTTTATGAAASGLAVPGSGLASVAPVGAGTQNQLIFDISPPLTRVAERNSYRASLIAFQRQRRALMDAEDNAVETAQGDLRALRVFAENYKIQQRQVELAYLTVESSLENLTQPPQPSAIVTSTPLTPVSPTSTSVGAAAPASPTASGTGAAPAAGGTTGAAAAPSVAPSQTPQPGAAQPTQVVQPLAPAAGQAGAVSAEAPSANTAGNAAALTQQLLTAQSSLITAQSQILMVWVNYLSQRMQLYRDLELMRLDSRGVWIDDVAPCQCPPRDAGRTGQDAATSAVGRADQRLQILPGIEPVSTAARATLGQPD